MNKIQAMSFLTTSLISTVSFSNDIDLLPKDVAKQYVTSVDTSISDEFNNEKLDTDKWGRRKTGSTPITEHYKNKQLVAFESEKNDSTRYISIKATAKNGAIRTAGIVSKASGYYGFYTVKFRYKGFDLPEVMAKKSIWHPSVWSAKSHITEGVKRNIKGNFWTEIDFFEWENHMHGWSSDAPARLVDSSGKKRKVKTKKPGLEKAILKDEVLIHDDRWQTIGLEYTPEYLKLWVLQAGKWQHYGDRIAHFVTDNEKTPELNFTKTTLGKKAAQPSFWYIGNIVAHFVMDRINNNTNTYSMEDVSFDVDYFRYYRHKSVQNANWPWENQLPNGG